MPNLATSDELKQDLPGITLLFVTSDDLKQDLGLFLLKIVADAGACNPGDWQVADI